MTKHTPGPWNLKHVLAHSKRRPLAKFEIWLTSRTGAEEEIEIKADAHLIAAAPDMLEALKAIASCLAPEDNDYAAQKVRSAIAKAEGRAS